jgi:hypothetical protein
MRSICLSLQTIAGGVLLAVKDTLLTSAVPELQTNCEIVWCKLEIVGHKTVYLSTYYNPKTSNEESFDKYKTRSVSFTANNTPPPLRLRSS